MAQDPEDPDELERDQDQILTTHALDMVTLSNSGTIRAEMEADMIRGLLESNGIPVLVAGAAQYLGLGFEVKVPRGKVREAEQLIAEAQEAGPAAAAEAEAESEK
jgi:Putative prokaryotic signal transducing protein